MEVKLPEKEPSEKESADQKSQEKSSQEKASPDSGSIKDRTHQTLLSHPIGMYHSRSISSGGMQIELARNMSGSDDITPVNNYQLKEVTFSGSND